jgi:hypothetical protein
MSSVHLVPPQVIDAAINLDHASLNSNERSAIRQRLETIRDYCNDALMRDARRFETNIKKKR